MTDERPAFPDEPVIDRSSDAADADPAVSGASEQPTAYGSVPAAEHAAGGQSGTTFESEPAALFSEPAAPQLVEPPVGAPAAAPTYAQPQPMPGFPTNAQAATPSAAPTFSAATPPVVAQQVTTPAVSPEAPPAGPPMPDAQMPDAQKPDTQVAAAPIAAAPIADAPVAVAPYPQAAYAQPVAAQPIAAQPIAAQPGVAPYGQPYVAAPVPPKRKHNRLFGGAVALLSSAVFAALYAGVAALLIGFRLSQDDFMSGFLKFLYGQAFIIPVVVYVVLSILAAILLNRSRWFGHIIGSIVVGLLVYAISVGVILLLNGFLGLGPDDKRSLFVSALTQPVLIAAGFVAREVAMWFGFISAARGRRVVARNTQAREEFDREQAERADSGGYASA